ncbi:cytosine permease [Irregularibacter muris]|uniref:Cytosine permease n=1 Tax=Irregularibacter muris TaxID=1796619 RepID=A0AAE3L4J4_9FIRM|nr:cytosine permease [Irregularibacter muris]MCR1900168.1 cytosine permease [Irregularibacter muris]
MKEESVKVHTDVSGDYASSAIPLDKRQSSVNIFVTTAGWIICLSTMLTGGALISGMSLSNALIAAIGGMIILAAFAAPLAAIGAKHGVSTAMIAKEAFGEYGAAIFALIVVFLNGIGWFAYQAAFFAMTMNEIIPHSIFGNLILGSLIGGIMMTLTAVFGFRGVSVLSFIAVPMIVILSLFGGFAAIEQSGGIMALQTMSAGTSGMGIFQGITAVVGGAAMGAVVLSDVARFGKSAKVGATAVSTGYMVGGIFCIAAGALMAVAAQVDAIGTTPNLPRVMLALGLGAGALVILVLAQWTTNTTNVYSAALSLGGWLPVKQKYIVIVLGGLGTILAVFNIYEYFVPLLNFLGTALPPIAGVLLADYYVIRKLVMKQDYQFNEGRNYGKFNWLSWICVIVSAIIASNVDFFTASFNSIVIAFIIYSAIAIILRKMNISYMIGEAEAQEGVGPNEG